MEHEVDNSSKLHQLHQCANGCAPATRCSSTINHLCHSLTENNNSKLFRQAPEKYCRSYGLTQEEMEAVTDLDIPRLLILGANPSCLQHLTAVYALKVDTLGAEQTGMSESDFRASLKNE